ncbi:hypothetical protein [Streptomyces cellulosae]|uniref:Uncharacterized protein n=1 Tax=Streptomyces cellulosae TaxID=1968 RepID=A0ABW7YBT2_STRCE
MTGVLVAEREWMTVMLLSRYAPELSPVENMWPHIEPSPANMAAVPSPGWRLCSAGGSMRRSTGTAS